MEQDVLSLLTGFIKHFYKPEPVRLSIPGGAPKKRVAPNKKPQTESQETPTEKPSEKPGLTPRISAKRTPRTMPRPRASFAAKEASDEDREKKRQAQEEREKRPAARREQYREERDRRRGERRGGAPERRIEACELPQASMDMELPPLEQTFRERLFSLIREKNREDVEVYKKAQIDRRLFSKIRSDVNYTPSKATVIALAVSLKLNLADCKDLLQRAGYALSRSQLADVIVEFFFTYGQHDLFAINEALEMHGLPSLSKVKE